MIRIGETPVLLADPKGQLDRFFEAHHTTKLIRAFTESASVKIPRGKNLLFPNYPDLPLARLNQIVVPTGATRWSYGLFLVTTAQKDAILEESAASDNKLTVEFGSPPNWKDDGSSQYESGVISRPNLTLTMSPLPPRPMTPDELSDLETEDIQNVWLLCMVDQRYWWQFKNVDIIQDEEFADIQEIIDYLNEKMGTTIELSCANSQHSKVPDISANNNYENAAVILESLAWHIGCQLVPELNSAGEDGGDVETGFVLISVDDSPIIHQNNLDGRVGIALADRNPYTGEVTSDESGFEFVGTPITQMGGALDGQQGAAFLPAKIWVPSRGEYKSKTPVAVGLTEVKTYPESSAILRLHWEDTETPPDDLVEQAAKDFYGRFTKIHDYTFAGIQKWQPTVYDDCVIFFQTRFESGYRCQTRVRSWQHNLLPETIAAVGSENQIINFQIVSSTPGERKALVQIEQRSFTGPAYGSFLIDTVVDVFDTHGCHLNEPNVDLTARRGMASLMRTDVAAAALHFPDHYNPPPWYWCVQFICCPNTDCETA